MLDNTISNSVTVLEGFKNNTIWTGGASTALCEELNELINLLNKELANIDKFEEALVLRDEIIQIDKDIKTLEGTLWTIPADATPEIVNEYSTHNAGINASIQQKTEDRKVIREDIINILSQFVAIADIQIIDIPDIEGATVLFKYDTGCIYELTTASGEKYQAYIPYEVDPTKPVVVYDPGDSGTGGINSTRNWEMFKDDFENNGYDHIVIRSLRSDNSQYYNDLVDRLNLEPSNKLFVSHSGGTLYNIYEYCDLVEEGNNTPGVIAIMDGYSPGPWLENQGYNNILRGSDTVVLGFYQNNENTYSESYESLAKHGVNVIILCDKSTYGVSHNGVNLSLCENGVLDYLTGNGELPDNYEIRYYDSEKGDFAALDHSQVKTLDDVYAFFGIEG